MSRQTELDAAPKEIQQLESAGQLKIHTMKLLLKESMFVLMIYKKRNKTKTWLKFSQRTGAVLLRQCKL